MRVIIAGSRTFGDMELLKKTMDECGFEVTQVVSGGANGADTLGEWWAQEKGIPVVRYPAQWAKYGKGAGPKRNEEMALNADALVAFKTKTSVGTVDMISRAMKRQLPVKVVLI